VYIHSRFLARLIVVPVTLLLFFAYTNPLRADQSGFVLEGTGDSGIIDYALLIAVSGDLAKIAVKGQGCLGEMDAAFTRVDRTIWILSSTDSHNSCEIVLKETGNGAVETIQGPGCSYYHGAMCGFTGQFKAPTSNGLAPIFDPMG